MLPPPESEDCLFLNVWTPGVGAAKKRPVMVWLHGGGYAVPVPPQVLLYDGTNLAMRGDVVMVGVNHRLNVFGYTHLGDFGIAGIRALRQCRTTGYHCGAGVGAETTSSVLAATRSA